MFVSLSDNKDMNSDQSKREVIEPLLAIESSMTLMSGLGIASVAVRKIPVLIIVAQLLLTACAPSEKTITEDQATV